MSKYSEVETGWTLSPFQSVNRPPIVVPPPQVVICIPRPISSNDGSNSYSLDIQWKAPTTTLGSREAWITSYYVEFRRGESAYGNKQEVTSLYARYENVGAGTFSARVAAVVSANGKVSRWQESPVGVLSSVQAIADFSNANNSLWATEF